MMMKSLFLAAVTLGAIAATPTASFAADGCGPGRYYNGYRCASRGGPPPVVYGGYRRDRDYDRGYRRGGRGPGVPCQRGYTVQDGVCKPYTGR